MNKEYNQAVTQALKASLAYARDRWVYEAGRGLHSSRQTYINGLDSPKMDGPFRGSLCLKGTLPVMLEEGFSGFDLKDGFSRSQKARRRKDGGWYLTVPFRHMTTGARAMPKSIAQAAKPLGRGQALSSALVRKLGYGPQRSSSGYLWKNSAFDQMNHIVKTYDSGKKRGIYVTFRRVSDRSEPNSWMHSGFRGLKAVEKVAPKVEEFFYTYLENSL